MIRKLFIILILVFTAALSQGQAEFGEGSGSYGNLLNDLKNNLYEKSRMPIEADLEYLLVEGVYTNWQTTGASITVNGVKAPVTIDRVNQSRYAVINGEGNRN